MTGPLVHVTRRNIGDNQAECGCGWLGLPRILKAAAIVDAHDHSAHTRHMPARPLVVQQ